MTTHAEHIIQRFRALDRALQAKGWVATSPWWHEAIASFYAGGKMQLVPRVGRRGGKSSTLCRLAVCEALYGQHVIPHGDVGVVALIAQSRPEARKRLRTIRQILKTLGVRHHPTDNGIELDDRPIAFEVYAATVQGVSGFTAVHVICDEVSKWKDMETGVNPATEVLASLRPTMATQPEARIILSSSPFGRFDAHYDAFERGPNDFQDVCSAPTWIANPTLSEERTHQLELDPAIWAREYACVPSDDAAEAIVTAAEIDRVTRSGPETVGPQPGHEYVAAIDPAARVNAWTLVVAGLRWCASTDSHGRPCTKLKKSVVLAMEWRGTPSRPLVSKSVLHHIASVLGPYGVDTVWSDQFSGDALREIAADVGLTLIVENMTASSNRDMYKNLALWIRASDVELPPVPHVKQDILGVRRRITRSGETVELQTTPDGRHCDYAPAVARALRRPLMEPKLDTTIPGTREHEAARKQERFDRYQAEEERPHWQPKGAFDRGAGAFWRR